MAHEDGKTISSTMFDVCKVLHEKSHLPPCKCPPDWLYHSPLCPWFDCMHDPASYGRGEPGEDLDTDYPSRWRDGEDAARDTYPPAIGD